MQSQTKKVEQSQTVGVPYQIVFGDMDAYEQIFVPTTPQMFIYPVSASYCKGNNAMRDWFMNVREIHKLSL